MLSWYTKANGGDPMPYNEKQKEYTMRYLAKLKDVRFRVKPEEYTRYDEARKKMGYQSMRAFIVAALDAFINDLPE